jgi:N-acetylglutamate synthase-like GNAT family acetyltransferase
VPAYLVPIHEYNDCHNPDGPAGGQFCSGPGAGRAKGSVTLFDQPLTAAQEHAVLGQSGVLRPMVEQMVGVLPGAFTVRMVAVREGIKVILASDKISAVRVLGRDGKDLVVTLSSLVLKPELTKGGIGKDLLGVEIAEYARLGVDRILLEANLDVGAYAWARFGFKAVRPEILARKLRSSLRTSGLPDEHRRVLEGLINQHSLDPKLPWVIADAHYNGVKIGKSLLVGATGALGTPSWDGVFDMHDPESRARMDRYLKPPVVS